MLIRASKEDGMLKKFVSKALLFFVLDKDARDRLEARKNPSPEPAPEPPNLEPVQPTGQTKTEDTRELILDALRSTKQELAEKPKMSPGRQALIQQAMNVRRSKEHVLNGLSQEQRDKLYVVAIKTLQSPPGPGVGKKTLTRKKSEK